MIFKYIKSYMQLYRFNQLTPEYKNKKKSYGSRIKAKWAFYKMLSPHSFKITRLFKKIEVATEKITNFYNHGAIAEKYAADMIFYDIEQYISSKFYNNYLLGASSLPRYGWLDYPLSTIELQWYQEIKRNINSEDYIIFIAVDSYFFNIMVEHYVFFLRKMSMHQPLHIHIVNPGNEIVQKISVYKKDDNIAITFSFTETERKHYYAAVRMLLSKQLLNFYKKPLLITDADFLWKRKIIIPDSIDVQLSASLMLQQSHNVLPWYVFSGLMTYISPSSSGIIYAENINKYISHVFDRKEDNYWYVDQNALFFSWIECINKGNIKISTSFKEYFFSPVGEKSKKYMDGFKKEMNLMMNDY